MKRSRRSCTIEDLPEDVLINIFLRLSIKTILICRCVSKTLLNLLSSSNTYFTKRHFARSTVQFILATTTAPASFNLVHLDDDTDLDNSIKPIPSRFRFTRWNLAVVNSCNGFLCLAPIEYNYTPEKICNPLTGEYLNLPKQKNMYNYEVRDVVSGFGFSAKTNQYKVVRLVRRSKNTGWLYEERVVEVYTIGTKSWRTIGTAPRFPIVSYCTTFFDGKIHWVCYDSRNSEFIITFDLESETFGKVPPPPHFSVGSTMNRKRSEIKIGVLGEFLSISYNKELWVMKEYGSWTKVGVVEVGFDRLVNSYQYQAIKYLSGGKILMNYDSMKLISYDPVKKISKKFKVPQFPWSFETIAHVPSFMSFNDAMMGDKGAKLRTRICQIQRKRRN